MYYIQETIWLYGEYEHNRIIKFSYNKEELIPECEKLNKELEYHENILETKITPVYGKFFESLKSRNEEIIFLNQFPIFEEFKKYFYYRENGSIWGIRNYHKFKFEIKEIKKSLSIFDNFDSSDI